MPKTIIINDSIINKGILNEAIEFNQLPKHLRLEILRGKTPLSNNECFPYEGYLEKALVDGYKTVARNNTLDPNEVVRIKKQCQEIEKPIRNRLEEIVSETVTELFEIPIDKVDFRLDIVDSIDQSETTVPFGPDENMPDGLESIDDINVITKEVTKRKFQNAFIAGLSRYFTDYIIKNSVGIIDEFDQSLYDSYLNYMSINDQLLFVSDETITEDDKQEEGRVIVTLGNDEIKNQMHAQGTIFPILVYETIKGFLEIFTSHGIPSDQKIAKAVISKTDYLLAEPWYMRMGYSICDSFLNSLDNDFEPYLLPYILMKISQLTPDKYIRLMKEILVGTEKSKKVMKRLCDYAKHKVEQTDFDDRMTNNRDSNDFIIDDNKQI